VPGFRLRIGELEALIRATEDELTATMPELEHLRQQLQAKEQKCWELRRQRTQAVPTEDELRKVIDDPRYWRDGDPELMRSVSEGFKRLYPDELD
jgi:predicted  nucleic acid-binding Zn-ribbon protein